MSNPLRGRVGHSFPFSSFPGYQLLGFSPRLHFLLSTRSPLALPISFEAFVLIPENAADFFLSAQPPYADLE